MQPERKKLNPNTRKALNQLERLEKLGKPLRLAAEKWEDSWKSLLSIMLSARTRDETTIEVCGILFGKYYNLGKLAKAQLKDVEELIRPVNYYKTKARRVLETAKILVKEHKGKPPIDIKELMTLPGVGRKTANVFLSGMGIEALGVDTHVAYISQKLGWTTNKNPHKIEKDLKELFPKTYWNSVNAILVRFGRTYPRKKQDEILNSLR